VEANPELDSVRVRLDNMGVAILVDMRGDLTLELFDAFLCVGDAALRAGEQIGHG
jgi:hypothetical protein